MKPAPFDLHVPETVGEAVGLLAELGEDAKPLAGGQSLVPLMALRLAVFGHLVDLGRIAPLGGIRRDGDHVVIGAGVRQSVLERDTDIRRLAPLVAEATRHIGHFQIRNRGTLGGSLAHADPAAEYPAVAVALDAEVEVAGPAGTRVIAAGALFDSPYTTALSPDEVLVAVRIPVRRPGEGFALREVARRHGDFALAGCAARVVLDAGAGRLTAARVVLFGVGGRPLRLPAVEDALCAGPAPGADLEDVLREAAAALSPPEDVLATSRYRRSVVPHVARTAITAAVADAAGAA
ncbi:MAG TPA: xanthine dehydrogenase family protein subunit M [Baekduia sp.]